MLVSPLVRKGAVTIAASIGDIVEALYQGIGGHYDVGDADITILAADIAKGNLILEATTGAHTATLPTADEILAAVKGNLNHIDDQGSELYHLGQAPVEVQFPELQQANQQFSFLRRMYARNAGGAITLTAPATAGIFMKDLLNAAGGFVAFASNTFNDVIFKVVNATPSIILTGTMASPAALGVLTLSDKSQVNKITPGMAAYGSALTGDAGFIQSIDRLNGTVTFDVDADETGLKSITCTPVIHVTAIGTGTIAAAHFA